MDHVHWMFPTVDEGSEKETHTRYLTFTFSFNSFSCHCFGICAMRTAQLLQPLLPQPSAHPLGPLALPAGCTQFCSSSTVCLRATRSDLRDEQPCSSSPTTYPTASAVRGCSSTCIKIVTVCQLAKARDRAGVSDDVVRVLLIARELVHVICVICVWIPDALERCHFRMRSCIEHRRLLALAVRGRKQRIRMKHQPRWNKLSTVVMAAAPSLSMVTGTGKGILTSSTPELTINATAATPSTALSIHVFSGGARGAEPVNKP
eukprot:2389803-Rhodomonas_salina.3